ncbi:MAG: GTP-binding protein [Candidatus Thorarchaeota archaeon]
MAEEYDYLFKSIVVGDGGVGKTALTLRFSKGFFTEDYKMTIGVDFHVKTISIETAEGSIKCKLQLWDTGGQERFSSIRPMYYRGSLGAVLVFDLTNSSSFEHLPQWIEEVRANIKAEIPLLLVGNKSDLIDQRSISIKEINNFTRDFNLYYMETSAKTGDGVGDCFYILACLMIGSGVPEKLIANETIFSPGRITLEETGAITTPQPEIDYTAPPVPETLSIKPSDAPDMFESQPEMDYAAPPVPEPPTIKSPKPPEIFENQSEIDYAAPPVPEPPTSFSEINLPKQSEIEFKTPEEILSKQLVEPQQELQFNNFETIETETYKPKNIPFSPFTAQLTKAPEGFSSTERTEKELPSKAPFQVVKREEPTKPKPASMTFESPANELQGTQTLPSTPQESKSQSLVDYMPQTILSKKEKKKKEKKKKEKKKKEKKESFLEITGSTSLFQTLTQRTGEITEEKTITSPPFVATKKLESEETSKLRIIPNIAETETQPIGFMPITPSFSEKQNEPSKSQELLVCKQCGAVLSSDYAFCNKCGSKL